MAAQKKTASGGKSSGNTKGKTKTGSAASKLKERDAQTLRRKKDEAAKKHRVYAGLICLGIALFGFLGYFNTDAIVLNWFRTLFCGLTGAGYLFFPPALVIISIFLFQTKRSPFLGRVICTAMLPVILGALYQMMRPIPDLPTNFLESVKLLWQTGILMESGGAISGKLALVLAQLISRPATVILLALVGFLLVLKICNSSLVEQLSRVQDRIEDRAARREEERELLEEYEEEYVPEPEEKLPAPPKPLKKNRVKRAEQQKKHAVTEKTAQTEKTKRVKKAEKTTSVSETKEELRSSLDIPLLGEDELNLDEDELDVLPAVAPQVEEEPEEPASPENTLKALGIDTDLDLDLKLEELPKFSDILLEEDEIPPLPEESEQLADDVLQASNRLIRQADASDAKITLPEETIKVTREPAIQRVTKKDAQTAMTDVSEKAAAALEQPVEEYQFPALDLLDSPKAASNAGVKEEMASTQAILVDTIESFGITANLKDVTRGPAVARFEMELDRGVKLSKLTNLADDIALSLGVSGVRIAPVPDKPSMVGIEVPNRRVNPVPIRTVIDSDAFRKSKSAVSFALGKDIGGSCVISDISKLPHLLIAGTTGSGKSVCINSLLISLLYKASPEDVRLIMVDPKQVELGIYNGIPHLLIPVVTEAKKAAGALQWAVVEMTRRYAEIAEVGARKLSEYNKLAEKDPEREKMPSIVIVIDELADLMMVAGKEVEEAICRIAQLGRAAGMHLVVATQRPSSDVITGLMKSNIPSRISFAVASAIESRIILDSTGAEKLVGKGDMLYHPIGATKSLRVQGCLISDEEVARVVGFVKQNCGEAEYDDDIARQVNTAAAIAGGKSGKGKGKEADAFGEPLDDCDELLPEAVDIVLDLGQASVSMLQRRLKLGYARAARLVDQMEQRGYVGPFEGSKPRQVKITKEEWASKRQELYGANPEQLAIDMNESAAQDDLDELAHLLGDDELE